MWACVEGAVHIGSGEWQATWCDLNAGRSRVFGSRRWDKKLGQEPVKVGGCAEESTFIQSQ